jgi:hypothetical protein
VRAFRGAGLATRRTDSLLRQVVSYLFFHDDALDIVEQLLGLGQVQAEGVGPELLPRDRGHLVDGRCPGLCLDDHLDLQLHPAFLRPTLISQAQVFVPRGASGVKLQTPVDRLPVEPLQPQPRLGRAQLCATGRLCVRVRLCVE